MDREVGKREGGAYSQEMEDLAEFDEVGNPNEDDLADHPGHYIGYSLGDAEEYQLVLGTKDEKRKDFALAPLRTVGSLAEDKKIKSILSMSHLDSSRIIHKSKKAPLFQKPKGVGMKMQAEFVENKPCSRKFHDLAETKMTPEIARDLKIIKMRNYLDPKRFYKSADSKNLPTKFEIGTIVSGSFDSSAERVSKKQRRSTIVQEIMSDTKIKKYAKKTFINSQNEKLKGGKLWYAKQAEKKKPKWKRRTSIQRQRS